MLEALGSNIFEVIRERKIKIYKKIKIFFFSNQQANFIKTHAIQLQKVNRRVSKQSACESAYASLTASLYCVRFHINIRVRFACDANAFSIAPLQRRSQLHCVRSLKRTTQVYAAVIYLCINILYNYKLLLVQLSIHIHYSTAPTRYQGVVTETFLWACTMPPKKIHKY